MLPLEKSVFRSWNYRQRWQPRYSKAPAPEDKSEFPPGILFKIISLVRLIIWGLTVGLSLKDWHWLGFARKSVTQQL